MERSIPLPQPIHSSEVSLEEALHTRRSVRLYQPSPLKLAEVSQLLWSGQGITDNRGYRTAPSAGATFPLETFLVAGEVEELQAGIYHYRPHNHQLRLITSEDLRQELYRAALKQESVLHAPASIVLTADYDRTTGRYGDRGVRYVHQETGCVAENIALQAVALKLGTVFIGAFYDEQVKEILGQRQSTCSRWPFYPLVGRPRRAGRQTRVGGDAQ
jgi:SagB-type dehydrogenase family enzyme